MIKFNSIKFLIGGLIIASCTQKPAQIVQKSVGVYRPNYSETYVESPDGKIARSLRGNNNSDKAQKISIISKNAMESSLPSNYYTVKNGDSLWSISRKYDMKIQELASLNNLSKPYRIKPGQQLRISNSASKNQTSEPSIQIVKVDTYKVKSGDNLSTIAEKYNMKTAELAELNNLKKPYKLKVGQNLKIKTKQSINSNFYVVKSGDNLSTIAKKNNTSMAKIAELNGLKKPYKLKVGQKLVLTNPQQQTITVAKKETVQKPKPIVQQKSTAQKSEVSFIWPIKGEVVSSFGNKANGLYNDGINISATDGADFKATEDGVVAYVGNELRGYGTIILIKHNKNWISAYAHCGSVKVSRGDKVSKGQIIGTVGQTGNVNTPQLYFSLRSGREAVDPMKYLR